jgi:hypothetical protein
VSTSSAAAVICANAMYACLAAWLKFSSASFADNCLKAFDGNFPSLRFHIPIVFVKSNILLMRSAV